MGATPGLSRRALLGGGLLRGARARFDAQAADLAPEAAAAPTWVAGSWGPLALRTSAAVGPLLDALSLRPGDAVLEVALEDGPVAAAAAAAGATVTRTPPSAPLGFEDAAFDAAGSLVDVAHAPDPRGLGRELARVLAPGGRLALASWASGGALGSLLRLARPRGWDGRPERWGTYEGLMLALDGFPGFRTRELALTWTFADADELWHAVAAPFDDRRRPAVEDALAPFVRTHGAGPELRVDVVLATATRS